MLGIFGRQVLTPSSVSTGIAKQSSAGSAFQVSLANGEAGSPEAQACLTTLFWTDKDLVYMTVGATATASHFKLPVNQMIPWPIDDASKLSFYNGSGDAAVVWGMWRN